MTDYRAGRIDHPSGGWRAGSPIHVSTSYTWNQEKSIVTSSAASGATHQVALLGTWSASGKTAALVAGETEVALSLSGQSASMIQFVVPTPYADASPFYLFDLDEQLVLRITDGEDIVDGGFSIEAPEQPTFWYHPSVTGSPWNQTSVLYQSAGVSNADSLLAEVLYGGPFVEFNTDGTYVADNTIRFRTKAFNADGWSTSWATFNIGDQTVPVPLSASLAANGTTLTVTFDEVVFGEPSLAVTAFLGNTTAAYSSGTGTTSLVFETAREIAPEDAVTISYTVGLVSIPGDAVAAFSGFPVTNASAADSAPPVLLSAMVESGGGTIRMVFSEAVSIGAGGNGGFAVSASGGAATLTYSSGDDSSILYYTLSRAIEATETVTLAYTQPGNGIEDVAGNDLASFSGIRVAFDDASDGGLVRKVKQLVVRSSVERVSK